MITTSITIKQYLAEYLYTKFQPEENCNYIEFRKRTICIISSGT